MAIAQPTPRRVLLVYSVEGPEAEGNFFAERFRPDLSRAFPDAITFIEVSLQSSADAPGQSEEAAVEYLRTFEEQQIDLVVPVGGPAVSFVQKYRRELFPGTPMLMSAVDRRFLEGQTLPGGDAAMAVEHEPSRMIDNILRLLPDTRTVIVVIGASQLEQYWLAELKRAFQPFAGRLTFDYMNTLSFAEMLVHAAEAPPDSVILYGLLSVDARGETRSEERTLRELHAVAKAPIFGLHSTQLGQGIVGGPLLSIDALSRDTARVAARMLMGEPTASLATLVQRAGAPAFDQRELRRWGIAEARLQPGSIVQFRELTVWDRYGRGIIAAVTFVLAQAVGLVALLVTLARRRRAERSLRVSEERFRLLANAAPVMIWVAGPDKLCTDFNHAWLDFTGRALEAELGNGWTEAVHPDDVERCVRTFSEAFDRREPFRMEYRIRRHDGEYRWCLDSGIPRFTSAGFAGYVGSAMDVTEYRVANVALSNLSRRLMQAQEDERAFVARELHDDLCQRMMVLTMQLHGLTEGPLPLDVAEWRSSVAALSGQFADLGSEILALSDQLYSSKLQLLGLTAALAAYCQDMAQDQGVTCEFQHQGILEDVPHEVAVVLFRVLQEAVGNAIAHASVHHLTVSLCREKDVVRLDIVDEGVGFDPVAVMRTGGLGLIAIRERLRMVDGDCTIDSRPGAGTRVIARVPLRRARGLGGNDPGALLEGSLTPKRN